MEVSLKYTTTEMKEGLADTLKRKSPVPISGLTKVLVFTEEQPDTPQTLKELEIIVDVAPKGD